MEWFFILLVVDCVVDKDNFYSYLNFLVVD